MKMAQGWHDDSPIPIKFSRGIRTISVLSEVPAEGRLGRRRLGFLR
jgi:hypothetical protein